MNYTTWIAVAAGAALGLKVAGSDEALPNFIENPGFEAEGATDGNHPAPGWSANIQAFETAGGKFKLDSTVFHSGRKSLKASGAGTTILLTKAIPVESESFYVLSLWAKSAQKGNRLSLRYDFGQIAGKHTYARREFVIDTDWKQYAFKLQAPTGSESLICGIDLSPTVWIDDLAFQEEPVTFKPEDGRMQIVLTRQAYREYLIQYPAYNVVVNCNEWSGFSGLTLDIEGNVMFQGGGFSLSTSQTQVFSAHGLPMVVKETDEKGIKTLTWSSTQSEALDYSGRIICTPAKLTFSQKWVYKKPFTELPCYFSLTFNPASRIMQGAQYLVTYANGNIKQGNIQKFENINKSFEDNLNSWIRELVLFTAIGKFKYKILFTNIAPVGGRLGSSENRVDPDRPGLGIACIPHLLEMGGAAGARRGMTIEIELMN